MVRRNSGGRFLFPQIDIRARGLKKLVDFSAKFERDARRIRISALKSVGFTYAMGLRKFIRRQKPKWEEPSESSKKYRSKFREKFSGKARWSKRKKFKGLLLWLAKFTRYRVDRAGTLVDIDFGKTRKGQPGRPDKALVGIVSRHQDGYSFNVTPKMRKFFKAQYLASRKKRPQKGIDFFPLPKSKKKIKVPPRPILKPYERVVKAGANKLLARRIDRSYKRMNARLNRS